MALRENDLYFTKVNQKPQGIKYAFFANEIFSNTFYSSE